MEATSWPIRGRVRLGQIAVVAALLIVAALGWVLTADRMSGMDNGPGTDPGSLGFYLTAWVAMMAAMMFAGLQIAARDLPRKIGGLDFRHPTKPAPAERSRGSSVGGGEKRIGPRARALSDSELARADAQASERS